MDYSKQMFKTLKIVKEHTVFYGIMNDDKKHRHFVKCIKKFLKRKLWTYVTFLKSYGNCKDKQTILYKPVCMKGKFIGVPPKMACYSCTKFEKNGLVLRVCNRMFQISLLYNNCIYSRVNN